VRVVGILDLGKYEYDERYILTHLRTVQDLVGIEDGVSGLRLSVRDENLAPAISSRISNDLGYPFWSKDWMMVNQNLFRAVKLEKIVIFFVVLIMVIAASFNISITLYVNVLRRYTDISILKTLGMKSRDIVKIFTLHGLYIGLLGALLGVGLGLVLCLAFAWLQQHWQLLPGEVYKLNQFSYELRWWDMSLILLAAMAICFLATLAPALRGARLNPVEGLRYE
jgi:lipoprotein-releasing system permease protein